MLLHSQTFQSEYDIDMPVQHATQVQMHSGVYNPLEERAWGRSSHPLTRQRQQRCIDSHGQLHGQLRRDDRGDDHYAIEQQLEAAALLLLRGGGHRGRRKSPVCMAAGMPPKFDTT